MPLQRVFIFAAFLFLVLVAFPTQAANDTATQSAFDALLSLPQSKPEEGEWGHVAPKGFESEDEDGLILWLVRQKKAGADFNQTQHQGTLLHHAIRSGLEATARWLITHGADPLKSLDGGPDQPDSLALAIQYQRWSVIDTLLKLPKVTAPERAPQLLIAWGALKGKDEKRAVAKLLSLRMPLPKGKFGERLLAIALERNSTELVLALIEQGITTVPASSDSPRFAAEIRRSGVARADIEFADTRLSNPIFPYLIEHLTNLSDVDSLFKLHIRHPFNDVAFSRAVVLRTILSKSPVSVKRAVLAHIPIPSLKAALEEKEVITALVRWSKELTPADGDWAIKMLGDLPIRKPDILLGGMLMNAGWYDEYTKVSNLAASWGRVLAHLRAPLPKSFDGKLWMFVPQQHRLSLLQLGYRPSAEELSGWLDRSNKDVIREFWPHLKSSLPQLVGKIHESLLEPYSRDTENNSCSWGNVDQKILEKALILLDGGAKPSRPVILDAGCWEQDKVAVLQPLITAGMIEPKPTNPSRHFVLEQATCHFQANEVWRQALIKNTMGEKTIDGVQPITLPGEKECALLVWGGDTGGRHDFYEDSFTGMQHFAPCTEGQSMSELWKVIGGILQKSDFGETKNQGGELLLDTQTHQHFLLVGGIGQGTCGMTPFQLLTFENTPVTGTILNKLPRKSDPMQELLSQCGLQGLWKCFGETEVNDHRENTLNAFIDQHWASERNSYIEAVLALHDEALKISTKTGIFPHWTSQAIDAVSKADLPLEDKRRRTAWLFRHSPKVVLSQLSIDTLYALIGWLPGEDWIPIIKANRENSWLLHDLYTQAERQGKHVLACRFLATLKRTCPRVAENSELSQGF